MIERARQFAIAAHGDQKRKYTGEPYWHHPASVAAIVRDVPHTPEMIAAAYLHDTVEDTATTLQDIHAEFGGKVRNLVFWLTDQSKPEDGNRAARKAIDREHIRWAPTAAKTIKLADLIDNSHSIIEHDPDFARVYLREKRLLMTYLADGDATLYARAKDILIAQGYWS